MTARWRIVELDSLSERSEPRLYRDFVKSKTLKIVNFVKNEISKMGILSKINFQNVYFWINQNFGPRVR